jgi:hypothetical protein
MKRIPGGRTGWEGEEKVLSRSGPGNVGEVGFLVLAGLGGRAGGEAGLRHPALLILVEKRPVGDGARDRFCGEPADDDGAGLIDAAPLEVADGDSVETLGRSGKAEGAEAIANELGEQRRRHGNIAHEPDPILQKG